MSSCTKQRLLWLGLFGVTTFLIFKISQQNNKISEELSTKTASLSGENRIIVDNGTIVRGETKHPDTAKTSQPNPSGKTPPPSPPPPPPSPPPRDAPNTRHNVTSPPPPQRDDHTCTNQARLDSIHDSCQQQGNKGSYNANSKGTYHHIMVDDKHKVLYCYVPKAGCTSWKHLIALQSGKAKPEQLAADWDIVHKPISTKLGLVRLSTNSLPEIHRKVADYTKFVIVRNPLTRFYSAYVDKFVYFYKTYAQVYYSGILKKFYPDAPIIHGMRYITFDQLAKLVVAAHAHSSPGLNLPTIDEHWKSVTSMCHPCHINYDFIGKLETLEHDKGPLVRLFNATDLPSAHTQSDFSQSKTQFFNYTKVSEAEAYSALSEDTYKALLKIFQADMANFGYSHSDVRKPTCQYGESGCC